MAKRELNLNNDELKNETVEANVEETVEETKKRKKAEPKKEPVIGSVTGCSKLRIRKTPSLKGDVLGELEEGVRVEILDDKNSTFYKIEGGYCMKKFIKILPAGE